MSGRSGPSSPVEIEASFVRSAAAARDLPRDGLAEIALVGRSNVGKSSLINALVRRAVARTSAAPGKTRLANIYRVARGAGAPRYLIDLPGYGFARGDRSELEAVVRAYFGQERPEGQEEPTRPARHASAGRPARVSALLLVDARHPGLPQDVQAWQWLRQTLGRCALVATKIDKLTRGQRLRAMQALEAAFQAPALPVSAVTGEGMDALWRTIERLPATTQPTPPPRRPPPRPGPESTPNRVEGPAHWRRSSSRRSRT
ncbi:MAG: 50S ribosome-binding GTPase [Acidobacteria bacterium]|nr:50S ribosome-binding GTPase [Acidobacteriota bacterium]